MLSLYRIRVCCLAAIPLLSGCAHTTLLSIDPPVGLPVALEPLAGAKAVEGDDFYVQFFSRFDYKPAAARQEACRDFGSGYVKGGATSRLILQVRNETLHYFRESPVLAFQSATGRCAISLDAKKVLLSPWMRLDLAGDTQIDYRFASSHSGGMDLARVGGDVNTASNVLALSGVGTGIALMGKLASGWMLANDQPQAEPETEPEPVRGRQESRSLPPLVSLRPAGGSLNPAVFEVYETSENKFSPLAAEPVPIGAVTVSADVKPSLLLKIGTSGLPDARDLSLDELWRTPVQTDKGPVGLRQFIAESGHPEHPDLEPDRNRYRTVETACRKLKIAMKDLGFNRYDRNAVLYYFLDRTEDWKAYNVGGQAVLGGNFRLGQLQQFRSKGFGGCLVAEDYEAMKALGLAVNSEQDWSRLLQPTAEQETYFAAIRALDRQLAAVLRNPETGELEHQLFPLIAAGGKEPGKVLLQDRLGNFGLERILEIPSVPGEGTVVTAGQLARVFASLKPAELSCARPAFEQGRMVPKVAILAFTTATGSPLAKGAALEFEFAEGRIVRLAVQSPVFRDFRQDVLSHPEIGDCRIDPSFLERL